MSDKKIYEDFIKHAGNWIFGLPDSDLLMPIIELRFTPDEVGFLTNFSHWPSTIEELSQKLNIPADRLKDKMEPMIRKGLIYCTEGRAGMRYSLPDSIFFFFRMPGWKGEDDELNRKISPLINRYYIDHLGADFTGHLTRGLRAIPVAKTIEDTRQIIPYEDLMQYVEQEDYHTVSTCPCRHRHNLDPDFTTCKHETENCLHFGRLGKYIVEHDMGREISREETLEILASAADAGLVHGISNTKAGMDTICSCCACCCLMLETAVKMPESVHRGHQKSNYILQINHDTCKACGLCVKRCPMDALELKDKENIPEPEEGKKLKPGDKKELFFQPDLCLGCGVCVHKCPTQSLSLKQREEEQDIPQNFREAASRYLKERGRDLSEIF